MLFRHDVYLLLQVLMIDLAVMSADQGQGQANFAQMIMIIMAAVCTTFICVFPHVKVTFFLPARQSPCGEINRKPLFQKLLG